MLYVTTRDSRDAFTAYHALCKDRDSSGGFYIPIQAVRFSEDEILALKDKSFGKCVADILNIFFSARLDGWDVEYCIGRYPTKLIPMSHRLLIAEIWNNPEWDLSRFVRNLRGRILGKTDPGTVSSNWTWIAVRIAFMFGLFGELMRAGLTDSNSTIDISVCSGDFSAPMAVWYARQMGLPIGTIVFSCSENSGAWDLLNHGELQTRNKGFNNISPSVNTIIPDNLERLIYGVFGEAEAQRFADAVKSEQVYTLSEEQRIQISQGLFAAVVSDKRTESVIRNVYRTRTYLLSPNSAQAYAGLQDFRTTRVETGPAIILTEQGPICAPEAVSKAIGISVGELRDRTHTP